MNAFFEVCVKGFRSLMVAKPKWHFVRELISNSLDELSVKVIRLTLRKEPRFITIICEDDGKGFERISDAFTLFAHTKKRSDVSVRGRFNMGEKELASISKYMSIETTTGKVVFKDGKRYASPRKKLERGTIVTAKIGCSNKEFDEIVEMVATFIIPSDKKLVVDFHGGANNLDNGYISKGSDYKPDFTANEILETILFDSESGGMRPTKRKTEIQIYSSHSKKYLNKEVSYLFELGIPVQEIECSYNVNVNQKIPMNANRDSVKDSYLRDIYAIVLNHTHDQLDESNVSDSWVRLASEDERVTDDAFKSVKNARYGDKAVLWSSDLNANEDARDQGYEIIHGKSLSPVERDRMKGVGMVSASQEFKRIGVAPKLIKKDDWTKSMFDLKDIVKKIANYLTISMPTIQYVYNPSSTTVADYSSGGIFGIPNLSQSGNIRFNLGHSHWGTTKKQRLNFDPSDVKNIDVIMHELAHRNGADNYTHDRVFYNTLSRDSAILVKKLIKEVR